MHDFVNSLDGHSFWQTQQSTIVSTDKSCSVLGSAAQAQAAKLRLRWTPQLHSQFLQACNSLGGPDKATPKQILLHMGVQGLGLFHVKSHLQKYRNTLKGLDEEQPEVRGGGVRKKKRQVASEAALGKDETSKATLEADKGGCIVHHAERATGPSSAPCSSAGGGQRDTGRCACLGIRAGGRGKGRQCIAGPAVVPEAVQQQAQQAPPAGMQQLSSGSGGSTEGASQEAELSEGSRRHEMQKALAMQLDLQRQLGEALEAQRDFQARLMAHGEFIQTLMQQSDADGGSTNPKSPSPKPPARPCRPKQGAAQRSRKRLSPKCSPSTASKAARPRRAASAGTPSRALVLQLHEDSSTATLVPSSRPPPAVYWQVTGGPAAALTDSHRALLSSSFLAGLPEYMLHTHSVPSAATAQTAPVPHRVPGLSATAPFLQPPMHAPLPTLSSLEQSMAVPPQAPPGAFTRVALGTATAAGPPFNQKFQPVAMDSTAHRTQQTVPHSAAARRSPVPSRLSYVQLQGSFPVGTPTLAGQQHSVMKTSPPHAPSLLSCQSSGWKEPPASAPAHHHTNVTHSQQERWSGQCAQQGQQGRGGCVRGASRPQHAPQPPPLDTTPKAPEPLLPLWMDLALAQLPDGLQGHPQEPALDDSDMDLSLSEILENPSLLDACLLP